jgi:hypothetical protein
MVLDSLQSPHSRRNYAKALDHLFAFCAGQPLSRALLTEWRAGMASLSPDSSPRSLTKFTAGALGHERFKSIDRIENDGLDVIGPFHLGRWGDFRTYFRFQLSSAGKIKRLGIGQAESGQIWTWTRSTCTRSRSFWEDCFPLRFAFCWDAGWGIDSGSHRRLQRSCVVFVLRMDR